jgi:hypothetical protein
MTSEWVDAASKLPVNGGDRWRLSRRLEGGFHFCLLPRCTGPRLSAGEQKILVPFFAVISFVETRIPVFCDIVNNFGEEISLDGR